MTPARSPEALAYAVILAGGRGTRFWPRSRLRTPKQLLKITGSSTMIEQTVERLSPLISRSRTWIVTNQEQSSAVRKCLPRIPANHVIAEPLGRNTAAAIGLASAHLLHEADPDSIMAVLPADHFISQAERYRQIVRAALKVAADPGALVVLGIPPSRPETGYGYIERERAFRRADGQRVYAVRRFVEKPPLAKARIYAASNRYFWNAGMFFWRISTYLDNLKRFLPQTHAALLRLAGEIGTRRYERSLRAAYAKLENISVDYAVLEPASRDRRHAVVSVIPADIGWSDIGSWAAVYELLATQPGENVSSGPFVAIEARGNFLASPKKFVAAVGVENIVLVETPDAILVCSRDRAQDVGRVVKWLEAQHVHKLL